MTSCLTMSCYCESDQTCYDNSCSTCCCTPCCCEPCDFVPPCPPDTCAYNAPFEIDIKCEWGFFVTGSFVYFQAKEENLDYLNVTIREQTVSGTTTNNDVRSERGTFCYDYKPGFRVGLGMEIGCDDWVLYAEYFRYHNKTGKGSKNVELPAGSASTEFVGSLLWHIETNGQLNANNNAIIGSTSFNGGDNSLPMQYSANVSWNLDMDIVDFNLSRKYYVGRCLTFQTHVGLRAAWINQTVDINYLENSGNTVIGNPGVSEITVNAKTESWGVGPRIGLNTDWKFCGGFFLFGDAAFSILFTDYDEVSYDTCQQDTFPDGSLHVGEYTAPDVTYCFLRPQANINLGLGWADYFCCNDWYFDLRVGYEAHVLWNQNMFCKNFDNSMDCTVPGGDLYLHGLVIKASLDF